MRQYQTILGHVLEDAVIAIFVIVEDEVEVVMWSFCRVKYERSALTFQIKATWTAVYIYADDSLMIKTKFLRIKITDSLGVFKTIMF